MKQLLAIIIIMTAAIGLYSAVEWGAFQIPSFEDGVNSTESETYEDESESLWVDTVMFAKGHSFGYSGDVSMWGGWYFDTIPVGTDLMLSYDSVAPSTLRLNLVTRESIVDMGDPQASAKIREFMNPIQGFKRYQQDYEETLDSIETDEYGTIKCTGYFSVCIDFADTCIGNSDKINRFICDLTGISERERSKVPALSAFYAGFNTTKYYRPAYSGNTDNVKKLTDFLAHRTFENWRRGGDTDESSNGARFEIRSHIANSRFVTVSIYDYERIGIGHGGYTETFHSMDMSDGKSLKNKDIFRDNTSDEVKMLLFEVMAKDKHFLAWHEGLESADEVEPIIEAWQSPSPALEGTIWEEPKREFKFELPECALSHNGVIFSFQPYEIDCWAAGAYHFVVPYNKLRPYLTKKAKRLIDGVTF